MQEHYLSEHLRKYAKFEIKQGYELRDIRGALLKYGYKKHLVDHVLEGLSHLKPKAKKPSKKQMNEDMYVYIQSMLFDYVKKQIKSGYSLRAIRNALLRSGHHADMIDKAIKLIKQDKIVDYGKPINTIVPPLLVTIFSIFLLLVFVLFISISTDQNIIKVIMTMMPAFLGLVLTYMVVSSASNIILVKIMPLLATAITILTYVVMLNYTLVYNGTDMTVLLSLNVVSSFLLSGLISVLAPKPK